MPGRALRRALVGATGIALSQGWFVLVSVGVAGYASRSDLGFVLGPLWVGYALGLAMALLFPAPSHSTADEMGLGTALSGYMLMIVSYTLSAALPLGAWQVGVLAFMACSLVGHGTTRLFLSWVARSSGVTRGDGGVTALVWSLTALECSLVVAVASCFGHSVWASLFNALTVLVSCSLVELDRRLARSQRSDVADTSGASAVSGGLDAFGRTGGRQLGRLCLAGALLGFAQFVMAGQFVNAPFARALGVTWAFSVAGALLAGIVALAVFGKTRAWRPSIPCWFLAASMVVAFYPIDPGSDFSLKFAVAGTALVLCMTVAVVPPRVDEYAAACSLDVFDCHRAMFAGYSIAAAAAGAIGFVAATLECEQVIVYASAIVSMILGFVSLVFVLRVDESAMPVPVVASEADEGALTSADLVLDRVDFACESIARAYSLTSRELDVLRILGHGYDVARIQSWLSVSEGTALTHKRHIYQKLGVHTRNELLDLVNDQVAHTEGEDRASTRRGAHLAVG